MKTVNLKNGIIAALLLIVISLLLFKCNGKNKSLEPETNPVLFQDTVFLRQWRKERVQKQALVKTYETKIEGLQNENKILRQSTKQSKQQLSVYRTKADSVDALLQISLKRFMLKDSSINDTIIPLINVLSGFENKNNLQCDTTIALLEKEICNKDSAMYLQKQIEIQLKDFNQEQTLQTDYLTNQLNLAYKTQKKKDRQAKLLKGGLLILSGITTSLLFIQLKK